MQKPGWIRMSIHPTTTNAEIKYVCDSIKALAVNHAEWALDYQYNTHTNEFTHLQDNSEALNTMVAKWLEM
jgi:hypothetical protein